MSEILKETGLPQTLASFHLRTLREEALVKAERRGAFVYYRLADPSLLNLLEAAEKYAGSLPQASDDEGPAFRWPPWAAMCRLKGIRW